jgi:hypothetical protein
MFLGILRTATGKGGEYLPKYNNLDEVPIAELGEDELRAIRELEARLGDRYYLIAFKH